MKTIKNSPKNRWIIFLFLALSFTIYFLYYLVAGDLGYILNSFVLKLAFLPIYVLFTTLLVNFLLSVREKKITNRKKNMIIGVFFTEMGKALLRHLSSFCHNMPDIEKYLGVNDQWTVQSFQVAKERIKNAKFDIAITCSVQDIHEFLLSKREFMIQLLQNPHILEDESFTNLLLGTFHLSEELIHRTSNPLLVKGEAEHLAVDIKRIYGQLIIEWLSYLEHLNKQYPFLYNLEASVHPYRRED